MNREIKFRAWLEPDNRMERGLFGLRSDGEPSFQSNQVGFKVTLMQFTGLHDRNGKEVYEGDILLLPNGITVPVYYDSGAFWAGVVLLLSEDKSSVVIGNKWENPELDPDQ